MSTPLYSVPLDWKGVVHTMELFEAEDADGLSPVTQVQVVPFLNKNEVVVFKHIDGYFGLPGGTIEEGESFDSALRREVREEIASEILEYKLIGYEKDTEVASGYVKYLLRYVAQISLLDEQVNDPDGKALDREVIAFNETAEKLGWGERGSILLNLAQSKFTIK